MAAKHPKTCDAYEGPEGERCAVPSPCSRHEPAQTMAARIVELEGHRAQWRRRAAELLTENEKLRAALEEIRDTAQFTDECNIASMAEAALGSTSAPPVKP